MRLSRLIGPLLIPMKKKMDEIIHMYDKYFEYEHELIVTWLKLSELMYM